MAVGFPTRIQGLKIGLGSAKQASVGVASTSFNKFSKLNMDVPFLRANTETDKDWIGRGNEFIETVYKTNKEPAPQRIEKYGSCEFSAWAWAYALGNVNLATGLYTIKAIDPGAITGLELPYFSVVVQLPSGGGEAIDETHLGCSIESVETAFRYGPTLASLRTTAEYVGSGRSTVPSAVSLPATLAENYALASSMSITVNGVDYVSSKMILMGSISWRNNLLLGLRYTPGSGLDSDGFAVGDRTMIGNRVPVFTFTAFLDKDSAEYAKLVAQSTGTASVKFTFDATHYVQFDFPNTSIEAREVSQEEGLATVVVGVAPRFSTSDNTPLIVTSKNDLTDIAQ